MNSRSSVNETNLVNLSADLSTLNQLDSKESLLSFPFDHLYACHSEGSDRRQSVQLDKEVEISTHCVVAGDKERANSSSEFDRLTVRLAAAENQNTKLKDLLIYHLDLVQQQNELITKREKLYQALKQENDALKSKLNRKLSVNQKQGVNTTIAHVPTSSVTSTAIKSEPSSSSQIMYNSFTELLMPDRTNLYLFNNDVNKPNNFEQEYSMTRSADADVSNYLSGDLGVSSLLDGNLNCDNFTMIENKRAFVKKEIKTENRSEPYTVTSNSGNPVIQKMQRNRRRTSSGIGSLSRMSKSTEIKVEVPESSKMFEEDKKIGRNFSLNKKSKMINTYGKSRSSNPKRPSQFTGSLSDRLQLIDTTPTGEDPYQLGEADMREQSPIPKLMLQKTNHGRLKICTDTAGEGTTTSRRIYDAPSTETSTRATKRMKMDRYNMSSTYTDADVKKEKTVIVEEPDLDIVKTEPEIDWRLYTTSKSGNETSLCDFSYGENPNNLASHILPAIDTVEFHDFFTSESSLNLGSLNTVEYNSAADRNANDKSKRRAGRTTSLIGLASLEEEAADKQGADSKRGRKRALSTTGLMKGAKQNAQKAVKPKLIKGKAICRGKKSPVPGMVSTKPYHTLVGDPDLSWYLGLDPDVKLEDVDHSGETKVSTVEVPRWREKPYTSCYTLEGTENLDDKVFEKRHQKLEAEERRQLRWHMRRMREQRHVERLRQRQRDSWCSGGASPANQPPSVFTIWPQPQRDVKLIEITDTLPVMAFGEILPDLPPSDFMLPWVRTSKALKRSKRSKTLH